MDATTFNATIAKFGETNLICINFNNAGRAIFPKMDFTLAANYVAAEEAIHILELDGYGKEYRSIKYVYDVQGMIFATAKTKRDQLDTRLLSS